MNEVKSMGTAVVTGASAGIGALYVDRLARRGYDVILIARDEARLNKVAGRIGEITGRTLTVLRADLNDRADLRKVETLLRTNQSITMLVNNAGFGSVASLLDADIDKMEDMISLNVTALTRLTYAAVPGFVARGDGAIINISSIVGIAPEVLNGVYGATKAYVLALAYSLHKELAGKGVRIQTVLPGATATEFWDAAGFSHSDMPASWVMKAEDLVDAALAGYDMGELITIPPLQDGGDWTLFEAARRELSTKFQQSKPGARYCNPDNI
ncbi:short-subunit dehydrogenase [Pseudomonas sp. JUb42]|jgi:short-subunit dehydrogenase|uniref:SDR family NAD(P)-dependent oxidoreductase n=1 Tax=Pseudomonas sp. JUb42 TaxID=2940611 RepID=UPI002166DA58|nr:SDR family oxidoreductase [Pseudomonas sp. JUb42]MCS3468902.1 short-subunit dehydrogenase [Pseudomonas sp. JUb42]